MLKIGHSYDVHQLVENRKLILGGIEIQHEKGLLGHSDADVLLHAITEAIIGALCLGDIGTLFPDTDDKYKDIDSMILLKDVIKVMKEKKYQINNIDASLYLERPKMRPHIDQIRENIASNINIDINCINIKATRGEKMGFIGREEGIASEAVVLLTKVLS
jgi:2-C-methyl-D-erythritol 2,4-cyclodiphosphate synthase